MELSSYLEGCQAGFITFILGQCNSGGFIDGLKASNRVVSTACKADERSYSRTDIPYDEFLYRWTCTLNGQDAFGNSVTRNAGIINAHNYAASNDRYANGGSMLASETPAINYFTNSVVSGLALDSIPPTVYLCFDMFDDETVCEQETKTYVNDLSGIRIPNNNSHLLCFWKSPYIWMRNQKDGEENHDTQTPKMIDGEVRTYVYVDIRNKGVKPYNAKDAAVHCFWTEGSLYVDETSWKGTASAGSKIGVIKLLDTINPGGHSVRYIRKTFDDCEDFEEGQSYPVCVLAGIGSMYDDCLEFDSTRIAKVWDSDMMVQSNVVKMEQMTATTPTPLLIGFTNKRNTATTYGLRIKTNMDENKLTNMAELCLSMSPTLSDIWKEGGMRGYKVAADRNVSDKIALLADSSVISNIVMEPRQACKIGLGCNFLADSEISKDVSCDVDVMLIEESTGKCIGGETFRIHQGARPAISTDINSTLMNGHLTLSAENSSEQVSYKWYDSKGNLIGTGNSINVPASSSESEFTVRSESLEDGAVSYSKVNVSPVSAIKSLENTKSSVKVVLRDAATSTTVLKLSSASASLPTTEYEVEEGERECEIPTASLPSGVYGITLVEDGIPVESRKVLK